MISEIEIEEKAFKCALPRIIGNLRIVAELSGERDFTKELAQYGILRQSVEDLKKICDTLYGDEIGMSADWEGGQDD